MHTVLSITDEGCYWVGGKGPQEFIASTKKIIKILKIQVQGISCNLFNMKHQKYKSLLLF